MKVLPECESGYENNKNNVGDTTSRFSEEIEDGTIINRCTPGWLGVAMVTPTLYLCGAPAISATMLRGLQVTCIVNAAAELPATPAPDHVTCVRVVVLDTPAADMLQHIDATADAIERVRERGGRTLVHCVAGVSRSATLCLGYLIKHQRMSLRDAFLHLRSKRPSVKPNCGFFRQLIEYECKLLGSASVRMVYSQVTRTEIPDLYEQDYQNMLDYQMHCKRRFGRN